MYRHLGIGMRAVLAASGTATTLGAPGLPPVLRALLGLTAALLWLQVVLLVVLVVVTVAVRTTGSAPAAPAPSGTG